MQTPTQARETFPVAATGWSRSALAPVARSLGPLALAATLTCLAAGCGKKPAGGPGGGMGGFAVNVKAVAAKRQPVEEKIALVASIDANESVSVKSQIDGTVELINFDEGQPVTNDQVLIKLDTRKL